MPMPARGAGSPARACRCRRCATRFSAAAGCGELTSNGCARGGPASPARRSSAAAILTGIPAGIDAGVVADAGTNGCELVAHVALDRERHCTDETLQEFLSERLAAYMVPRRFVRLR